MGGKTSIERSGKKKKLCKKGREGNSGSGGNTAFYLSIVRLQAKRLKGTLEPESNSGGRGRESKGGRVAPCLQKHKFEKKRKE